MIAANAPGNQGPQNPIAAPKAPTAPGTVGALSAATAPNPQSAPGPLGHSVGDWQNLLANQGQQQGQATQQFQGALDAARSGINSQYQTALSDIMRSHAAAGTALATLPGDINKSFAQYAGTTGAADSQISGLAQAAGVGGPTPNSQIGVNAPANSLTNYMQPTTAAVAGTQAALQSNVPLLRAGIDQETQSQQAQAALAQQGDMNTLNQSSMAFYQQQAAAQQAQQYVQQNAQAQHLYDLDSQNNQARLNPPTTGANAQILDPVTGLPKGYTGNDVATAEGTPKFQSILAEFAKVTPGVDPTAYRQQVWHQLQTEYAKQPALLAAIQAKEFPGQQNVPNVPTAVNKAPGNGGLMGSIAHSFDSVPKDKGNAMMTKLYSAQSGFKAGSPQLAAWMKQRGLSLKK